MVKHGASNPCRYGFDSHLARQKNNMNPTYIIEAIQMPTDEFYSIWEVYHQTVHVPLMYSRYAHQSIMIHSILAKSLNKFDGVTVGEKSPTLL